MASSAPAQPCTLRLLGAPDLAGAQGPRALPSRRAMALLACLALDGPSTRAALADRLWPALDGAAARRNLRRELARLRDAGLADTFTGSGDLLRLGDAVRADVREFEAACERGACAAAVALWRGLPLDGFTLDDAPAFDAWLAERRQALRQRWAQAVRALAVTKEQAGAAHEALALHHRLHDDDPQAEAPVFDAMRLHQLLGEHAAALDLHARWLQPSSDDAAPLPSPRLEALAERIRAAQRLQPLFGRSERSRLPALDAPLIGRDAEAETLGLCDAAFLLVEGEAGVGKTRLVQEVLRAPQTLALRCDAAAQQAPMHPWAEALHAALESPARAARLNATAGGLSAEDRRQLSWLVPSLAPSRPGPAAGAAVPPTSQRERFFDALAETIDRLAGAGGVVWVDDLHWADDASLALLAHLALRRGASPRQHVRIVAAARPEELRASPAARDLVRRMERAGLLQRLPLARLGPGQTQALLSTLAGPALAEQLTPRLWQVTAGNAFHLLEALRALFDAGDLGTDATGAWVLLRPAGARPEAAVLPLPPTVAEAVIERVEHLGTAVTRLLEAASLARSGFTLADVRPATSLDEWQAVDALETALDARLLAQIERADDAPNGAPLAAGDARAPGYRFVHDLIREALAAQLRPERRRLLHERLAQALMAREASHGVADRIALHLEQAGHGVQAVPWRRQAAAQARALFAWREALEHLERAAALAAPPQQADLARERLEIAAALYDLHAAQRAAADLAHLAQAQPVLQLEALVARAELALLSKQTLEVIDPLRAAIAADTLGEPTLHARAVAVLANCLLDAGRVEEAERALGTADEHDAGVAHLWRAQLLTTRANAARMANQPERAQPLLAAAVALLQAPEHLQPRLQAQNLLAHTQYLLGHAAQAVATLESTLAEAEQARLTVVLRSVLPNLVTLCAVQGQLERAQAFLERGMHALRTVDNPATYAALQGRLAELQLLRGDLGAALDAAEAAIAGFEANGGGTQDYAPWVMKAHILEQVGRPQASATVFDELLRSPARKPGAAAEAIVHLRQLALRIAQADAHECQRLADELARVRIAPDGAYPSTEADYWRARALWRAGRGDEALALSEGLTEGEIGLLLHPASLWALRVEAASGSGAAAVDATIAAAQAALSKAPPLPALELSCALVQALRRRAAPGDSALARQLAIRLDERVQALAASLHRHPALAESLRRRWTR